MLLHNMFIYYNHSTLNVRPHRISPKSEHPFEGYPRGTDILVHTYMHQVYPARENRGVKNETSIRLII